MTMGRGLLCKCQETPSHFQSLSRAAGGEVFWLRHENVPQITLEGALLFDFDFFSSSGMGWGGALGPCLNTMEVEEYFTPKLWFYNLYAGLPLSR